MYPGIKHHIVNQFVINSKH